MERLESVRSESEVDFLLMNYIGMLNGQFPLKNIDKEFVSWVEDKANSINYKLNKITAHLEKLFAALFFFSILPLLLLISVLIKTTSKGPLIYSQVRVGEKGMRFKIYKFRTMIDRAEQESGPTLSWDGDERVTRIGKMLRKTHLDELPQLINIIRGEMSFIGPRPERPELIEKFENNIKEYRHREAVKPGITGLAQICCGYDATPGEKLDYDLFYIMHCRSYLLKMLIITSTIKILVKSFT